LKEKIALFVQCVVNEVITCFYTYMCWFVKLQWSNYGEEQVQLASCSTVSSRLHKCNSL